MLLLWEQCSHTAVASMRAAAACAGIVAAASMRVVTSVCLFADFCWCCWYERICSLFACWCLMCCWSHTAVASMRAAAAAAAAGEPSKTQVHYTSFLFDATILLPLWCSLVLAHMCNVVCTFNILCFSCPEQLNAWPMTCDVWDISSERREDMNWPTQRQRYSPCVGYIVRMLYSFLCCKWLFLSEFTFNTCNRTRYTPSLPDQDRAERQLFL